MKTIQDTIISNLTSGNENKAAVSELYTFLNQPLDEQKRDIDDAVEYALDVAFEDYNEDAIYDEFNHILYYFYFGNSVIEGLKIAQYMTDRLEDAASQFAAAA